VALSEFADWFCLNSDRTFAVSPNRDPEFYFGRGELAESITQRLRRGITVQRVPKMVLFGAFGAGKTHTLYHIKWFLEHHLETRFEVRYVETPPDISRKSTYALLHRAMMDRVGVAAVRRLLEGFINRNLGPDLENRLRAYFLEDEDLVNVVRQLAQRGPQELTAWKWLRGEQLSDAQLSQIGVARAPELADLLNILMILGQLFIDIEDARLVFLIDELEQLEYVTGDEISTWEIAFRKLSDQENRSVGFVFAARGAAGDELADPLRHQAFTTRLQQGNFVEIPYLHDIQDVEEFIKDLVAHIVDRDCAKAKLESAGIDTPIELYPFTPEALEVLNQYIHDDPTRALPRELLFSLNECGAAAIGNSVVITEDIVQSVLY
jgi:hypothetical protein